MTDAVTKVTGVVRSYNDLKGFGLITPDIAGPLVFVNQAAIQTPGVKKLKPTDRVEYELLVLPEGSVAVNVRTLLN